MFIQNADTARDDFESMFQFMSVEVDEVSAMGEVIGWDGSEEVTVVVVFIVAVDGSTV
jgi:hypothetical protein